MGDSRRSLRESPDKRKLVCQCFTVVQKLFGDQHLKPTLVDSTFRVGELFFRDDCFALFCTSVVRCDRLSVPFLLSPVYIPNLRLAPSPRAQTLYLDMQHDLSS